MELKIRQHGGSFALIEDAKADFGLAFVCMDGADAERRDQAQTLTDMLNCAIMDCNGCNSPAAPDPWQIAHGLCEDDEDIEVLAYEGMEYPPDAAL